MNKINCNVSCPDFDKPPFKKKVVHYFSKITIQGSTKLNFHINLTAYAIDSIQLK